MEYIGYNIGKTNVRLLGIRKQKKGTGKFNR
jgi:hypothetical protein